MHSRQGQIFNALPKLLAVECIGNHSRQHVPVNVQLDSGRRPDELTLGGVVQERPFRDAGHAGRRHISFGQQQFLESQEVLFANQNVNVCRRAQRHVSVRHCSEKRTFEGDHRDSISFEQTQESDHLAKE